MLARAAILAAVIGDPRVEHHAVARPPRSDVPADRLHHAGAVRPQDVRKAVFERQALYDEEVEMVERRGVDADPHVARARGRGGRGNVGELEPVETAGGADHPGAHRRARAGTSGAPTTRPRACGAGPARPGAPGP